MRDSYSGRSLITGHTFTLDNEMLQGPLPFQIQEVRETQQGASMQSTLQHWLWLAGASAALALALFLGA